MVKNERKARQRLAAARGDRHRKHATRLASALACSREDAGADIIETRRRCGLLKLCEKPIEGIAKRFQ